MSSETLFLQKNKWPFFKAFALAWLANSIFFGFGNWDDYIDRWWRDVVFDNRVIVPILIFLVAPTVYALIRRENPIWGLIASFVPVGVAVGAINVTVPLVGLSPAEEAVGSSAMYTPLAIGLILSYACRVFVPPYEYKPETTGATGFFICWLITNFSVSYYLFAFDQTPEMFINGYAILAMTGAILCCFAVNDKAQLSVGEVMARAGLFACLLGAVSLVTLYTAAVAANEVKDIGPVMAGCQILMLYGAIMIIAASACGVRAPTDKELMTRDWHITEAFVFISLIVWPPKTLFELGVS